MKKITFLMAICLLMFVGKANAVLKITWYAEAGETKTIDAIDAEAGYWIEWGDGDESGMNSHTYHANGEYTVLIDGEITRLWMCGDAGNATGATSLSATEEMPSLLTLEIWTNDELTDLDLSNFPNLNYLNITHGKMDVLDISNNSKLERLDMKHSWTQTVIAGDEYPNLRFVDANNAHMNACTLNDIFELLPDLTELDPIIDEDGNEEPVTGTIYSIDCLGDAYSTPEIATSKGWVFGNGGTGDGGDCTREDEEDPDSIISDAVSGLNIYYNGANVVVEGTEAGDVVYLYTITGALKASKVAGNGAVEFDVNAGNVYIVKAGAHAQKVVSAK